MNSRFENDSGTTSTIEPPKPAANTPGPVKPAVKVEPVHSSWGDEEEIVTGFRKFRTPLIVGLLAIAGIVLAIKALSKADGTGVKRQESAYTEILIKPVLPPPPPPPPPKMEQEIIKNEEDKEDKPDEAPKIDTANKGSGRGIPVAAGNSRVTRRAADFGSRSRFPGYANQVSSRIAERLRSSPQTRRASMAIQLRVWADSTGRITRAKLDRSTGDNELDSAVQDSLTGLQLSGPPPDGMPMPILMKVTARRPQ